MFRDYLRSLSEDEREVLYCRLQDPQYIEALFKSLSLPELKNAKFSIFKLEVNGAYVATFDSKKAAENYVSASWGKPVRVIDGTTFYYESNECVRIIEVPVY